MWRRTACQGSDVFPFVSDLGPRRRPLTTSVTQYIGEVQCSAVHLCKTVLQRGGQTSRPAALQEAYDVNEERGTARGEARQGGPGGRAPSASQAEGKAVCGLGEGAARTAGHHSCGVQGPRAVRRGADGRCGSVFFYSARVCEEHRLARCCVTQRMNVLKKDRPAWRQQLHQQGSPTRREHTMRRHMPCCGHARQSADVRLGVSPSSPAAAARQAAPKPGPRPGCALTAALALVATPEGGRDQMPICQQVSGGWEGEAPHLPAHSGDWPQAGGVPVWHGLGVRRPICRSPTSAPRGRRGGRTAGRPALPAR